MNGPFDTDVMDESLALEDDAGDDSPAFDAADQGDGFTDEMASADDVDGGDGEGFEGDSADDLEEQFAETADDTAVWSAFEEEVADGLDAADADEFFARLIGGLGRAAGVIGRGVERAAGAPAPTAQAAARLAGVLGQRAIVAATARSGRSAPSAIAPLGRLFGRGLDEVDGFEAMADLFADDGVDAALPLAVGLAARVAARGLGTTGAAPLSGAARRALVRGVGAAARELVSGRGPQAVRALPRLARAAAHAAQRGAPTPDRAALVVQRRLPVAARRLAKNPQLMQRLERPAATTPARRPHSSSALPAARPGRVRTFNFPGPITLTMVTPR